MTRHLPVLLFALVVLAAIAGRSSPSLADWRVEGFVSPSGNITCAMSFTNDVPDGLSCEIGEMTSRVPPPPADCDGDWGSRFEVSPDGDAARSCYSDSIRGDYPTVGYGSTWTSGGVTCSVEKSGVTCRNKRGHGFFLSRAAQEIF